MSRLSQILRQMSARRRLQKMVAEKRNSFEVQDYAKRRAAAKLGLIRKREGASL